MLYATIRIVFVNFSRREFSTFYRKVDKESFQSLHLRRRETLSSFCQPDDVIHCHQFAFLAIFFFRIKYFWKQKTEMMIKWIIRRKKNFELTISTVVRYYILPKKENLMNRTFVQFFFVSYWAPIRLKSKFDLHNRPFYINVIFCLSDSIWQWIVK